MKTRFMRFILEIVLKEGIGFPPLRTISVKEMARKHLKTNNWQLSFTEIYTELFPNEKRIRRGACKSENDILMIEKIYLKLKAY